MESEVPTSTLRQDKEEDEEEVEVGGENAGQVKEGETPAEKADAAAAAEGGGVKV
jgi:hypothetical protein